MYADDNRDSLLYTRQPPLPDLYAGGFWVGPSPGPKFPAGLSTAEAQKRVEESIRRSPLTGYCENPGAYHRPGDLRTKRLKPPGQQNRELPRRCRRFVAWPKPGS